MSPLGLVFWFFRFLEKWTYSDADRIGCMSPGNAQYLIEHNPGIGPEKLRLLPNWIAERHIVSKVESSKSTRYELGVKDSGILCVFGGNLCKPQQVSFLLDVAEELRRDPDISIFVVGRGSESPILNSQIKARGLDNLVWRN